MSANKRKSKSTSKSESKSTSTSQSQSEQEEAFASKSTKETDVLGRATSKPGFESGGGKDGTRSQRAVNQLQQARVLIGRGVNHARSWAQVTALSVDNAVEVNRHHGGQGRRSIWRERGNSSQGERKEERDEDAAIRRSGNRASTYARAVTGMSEGRSSEVSGSSKRIRDDIWSDSDIGESVSDHSRTGFADRDEEEEDAQSMESVGNAIKWDSLTRELERLQNNVNDSADQNFEWAQTLITKRVEFNKLYVELCKNGKKRNKRVAEIDWEFDELQGEWDGVTALMLQRGNSLFQQYQEHYQNYLDRREQIIEEACKVHGDFQEPRFVDAITIQSTGKVRGEYRVIVGDLLQHRVSFRNKEVERYVMERLSRYLDSRFLEPLELEVINNPLYLINQSRELSGENKQERAKVDKHLAILANKEAKIMAEKIQRIQKEEEAMLIQKEEEARAAYIKRLEANRHVGNKAVNQLRIDKNASDIDKSADKMFVNPFGTEQEAVNKLRQAEARKIAKPNAAMGGVLKLIEAIVLTSEIKEDHWAYVHLDERERNRINYSLYPLPSVLEMMRYVEKQFEIRSVANSGFSVFLRQGYYTNPDQIISIASGKLMFEAPDSAYSFMIERTRKPALELYCARRGSIATLINCVEGEWWKRKDLPRIAQTALEANCMLDYDEGVLCIKMTKQIEARTGPVELLLSLGETWWRHQVRLTAIVSGRRLEEDKITTEDMRVECEDEVQRCLVTLMTQYVGSYSVAIKGTNRSREVKCSSMCEFCGN
jgi:hypothetical protein